MNNVIIFHHKFKDHEGELQKYFNDINLETVSIKDLVIDDLIDSLRDKFNDGLLELNIVLRKAQKDFEKQ